MINTQIRPINQTTFHILYFKYKIYFVPTGALVVAVLLLFNIIFPQIQQWYADQEKIVTIEGKIDQLNQSINTVKNINTNQLDKNITTVTSALPDGKDFAGILNAISDAAQQSGTSVGDYAFQVGDLVDSKPTASTFLQINVTLNGNLDHIRQFVTSLRDEFPISRVTEIHISGNKTASLTIVFYYKPFPKIAFTVDTTLQPLTDSEQKTLSSLTRFTPNSSILINPTPTENPFPSISPIPTTAASSSGKLLQ